MSPAEVSQCTGLGQEESRVSGEAGKVTVARAEAGAVRGGRGGGVQATIWTLASKTWGAWEGFQWGVLNYAPNYVILA